MDESINIKELNKLKNRLNIVRIGDIIGHYEDINRKYLNVFDRKKLWKKCGVQLYVRPRYPIIKQHSINDVHIIERLVKFGIHFDYWMNDKFIYIRDNNEYVKNIVINFDDFYTYVQCSNMIKSFLLKNVDNDHIEFESDKELMKVDIKYLGKKYFEYEL